MSEEDVQGAEFAFIMITCTEEKEEREKRRKGRQRRPEVNGGKERVVGARLRLSGQWPCARKERACGLSERSGCLFQGGKRRRAKSDWSMLGE
jgi:hypothetical protein